jgi:tRNA pseudouridine13 synthase
VALTQSDEDRLLGLNPPAGDDKDGKFRALRIELELGSSAYATMALREVTREETSVWHQIGLTKDGEDQEYKGVKGDKEDVEGDGVEEAAGEEEVEA